MSSIDFTDDTIRTIFGHEAAEDESIDRLKEYYFKNRIYSTINSNHSLRIVIGHKGIGKSALLKIAHYEDLQQNKLAIFVRPDDIDEIAIKSDDLNENIRAWKSGLLRIIHKKVLEYFFRGSRDSFTQKNYYWTDVLSDLYGIVTGFLKEKNITLPELFISLR